MIHYNQLLDRLFHLNLCGGMKLGLANCRTLQKLCGNPDKNYPIIHVAGTNGKGSVALMIAKALENSGFKVGLYTSPHIACFRERICINGKMIGEESLRSLLVRLFVLCDREKIPATFFEVTTLSALIYFAEEQVDYAVLETGLGGRLDATNIVLPILSVITSISLDHKEFLGGTIEEIAAEKAGIIKPGIPILIGPRVPKFIVQKAADAISSPLTVLSGIYLDFIEENRAIASAGIEILSKKIPISPKAKEKGLEARQPCRMETLDCGALGKWQGKPFPLRLILDAAHNPDGLEKLFCTIRQTGVKAPLRVLFGLSKTKDIEACLEIILRHGENFHLVEAPSGRGVEIELLEKIMLEKGAPAACVHTHPQIENTLHEAIELSGKEQGILVICGSFFIMAAIRACLGIKEPQDPQDMNER